MAAEAFGLRLDEDLDFAMNQFNRWVERIKRARGQTLEQIYQVAEGEEVAGRATALRRVNSFCMFRLWMRAGKM